ncbi:MBL fold metallo-hydrolase [Pseudalkalibacillus berkeleyi]|uniref:MBL fold metallo-hydrolase n=1 Tax=Pseudalkalibacillus berkeleyi TaxID=1069813 RepID=A0ABS9GYL7_9BACL|nr:MBL fold metallo-hydrolase [Pseudalkalibacillus berkeleyi]MCF6136906.1 MBL fold metallo-hydrolase [Pseudalkalibacillus berkeleyi]
MELIQLNHTCYYFNGPVNVGYVNRGNCGLIIDTGIDKQNMKKILKALKDKSLPITHLFISHAHADHYGAADYLQKTIDIYTFAPQVEEAILKYPILEPLYLSQGNRPLNEMRNKFLEAPPTRIDQVVSDGPLSIDGLEVEAIALPGHSIYQVGLKVGHILYAADSYFGEAQLDKHKIPFIIDAQATLASIEKLLSMTNVGMIPGHGVFEEDPTQTLIRNYDHHVNIISNMYDVLSNHKDGCSFEIIMKSLCEHWEVEIASLSIWSLYRTAIYSYLIKGIEDDRISFELKDFAPLFTLNK